MLLKKYYGKNLELAREEAKKELGPDIIVLESVDAKNDKPAVVTVMAEKKVISNATKKNKPKKTGLNAIFQKISNKPVIPSSVHQLKDKITDSLVHGDHKDEDEDEDPSTSDTEKAVAKNSLNMEDFYGDSDTDSESDTNSESGSKPLYTQNKTYDRRTVHQKHQKDNGNELMSRRKKTIYQNNDSGAEFKQYFDSQQQIKPIQQEVKALHRRFDNLEKLFSEALITANLEYVSHPAFQQLLEAGVQAPTISRWFESVLSKGIDPYEQKQSFMYELSNIVRNALFVSTAGKAKKYLLFTGPTGSGKTTLIMKLANNPEFMGNKNVALVSIQSPTNSRRYSILPLFADDLDIPFYKVTNGIEISDLLPKLKEFDYVLFDTQSISLEQGAAVREFWKIRQLVSSVNPIEIHYVINATLEKYYFKESYVENHPLQPDYVAITHLDETHKWGHLVPFLKTKKCDIRYVSSGSQIPEDIDTFNPGWFTQKILS